MGADTQAHSKTDPAYLCVLHIQHILQNYTENSIKKEIGNAYASQYRKEWHKCHVSMDDTISFGKQPFYGEIPENK